MRRFNVSLSLCRGIEYPLSVRLALKLVFYGYPRTIHSNNKQVPKNQKKESERNHERDEAKRSSVDEKPNEAFSDKTVLYYDLQGRYCVQN